MTAVNLLIAPASAPSDGTSARRAGGEQGLLFDGALALAGRMLDTAAGEGDAGDDGAPTPSGADTAPAVSADASMTGAAAAALLGSGMLLPTTVEPPAADPSTTASSSAAAAPGDDGVVRPSGDLKALAPVVEPATSVAPVDVAAHAAVPRQGASATDPVAASNGSTQPRPDSDASLAGAGAGAPASGAVGVAR
ncbi:MAG: hypothetical protein J7480_10620, partial [Microbacteriaceae bacterium]|nr:hypothetical protein [Microbacteriaceae bacterium]